VELVIAEKNNAAERIAEILSGGDFSTGSANGVKTYEWHDETGERVCIGLAGHVVEVDFTDEYNDWHAVEPSELVDAEIEKNPSKKDIVSAVERLARDAHRAVIATDYDSEGELIGKEAYEIIKDSADVPVDRVRFSSLTPNEVRSAFDDRDELDFDLAAAGEARQIIDLVWGAALTRYLSLASNRLGDSYLSVGRVQSPTLKILVDREKEIEEFEPDPYWEIYIDLLKDDRTVEAQHFYKDDGREQERVWDGETAETVHDRASDASGAETVEVSTRTRNDYPPKPFDTTAFIRAAGSLGFNASRAMSVAEELYTNGFISYPRTDNTVYPDDIDVYGVLGVLENHDEFADDAAQLAELGRAPTSGDKETTDHPPIYPTALATRDELSEDEWEVYELVVRRFFATLAPPAEWEHVRATFGIDGDRYKSNGRRLLDAGYHEYYPYFGTDENRLPELEEGETLEVDEARIEEKETQPPSRIGQSKLVERMEDEGVGTKCLTADTRVVVPDEDGAGDEDVRRTRVSELFDPTRVALADGDTDVAFSRDETSVLSLDHTARSVGRRDGTLVSRREVEEGERVFRVRTSTAVFSVTEDHPVYVYDTDGDGEGDIRVVPASGLNAGDRLVSVRPSVGAQATHEAALTWDGFASDCDKETKLYGTGCNDAVSEARDRRDESQAEFAERHGTYHDAVSRFETGDRDPPLWLLRELDAEPDGVHGLNDDVTFDPFPIEWTPSIARLLGSVLGDGSVHVSDGNTVDLRYQNTDPALIRRFVRDFENVFGVEPTVRRRETDDSRKTKYQAQAPSAVARVVRHLLRDFSPTDVPRSLQPVFVGALFDDEGHISTDGKAFISNTDHGLLEDVTEALSAHGVGSSLNRDQHKLYIRGRRDLESFLDTVPVLADEKFQRGVSRLRGYSFTASKATVLELVSDEERTSDELASELGVTRSMVNKYLTELSDEGYVERRAEGSNRSHNANREYYYSADREAFRGSVYAVVARKPCSATVTATQERDYDGYVYDLTVDEEAPNFAVEGGAVVHNSTRHNTIDKLYSRGYVESNPPRPTGLARAVVEAMDEYADLVTDPEMTEQLEDDMRRISEGEVSQDAVMEESREMLDRIFEILEEKEDEIGETLLQGLKEDRTLGDCPECGGDLVVRTSRGGDEFVGCDSYPECENTYPLPDDGKLVLTDDECDEHGLKHVKILNGRSTYVHGCPICKADEAEEEDDIVIGDCPDCGDDEGGELAIKQTRGGGRLVGCTRYPDCDYSLPLPRRGDVEVTDGICEEHDLPELVVHQSWSDEPWELGCPICNYESYKAEQEEEKGLRAIDGVGPATEEKLEDAGVETVDDLNEADPDELAEDVDGVTASRIEGWQSA